MHGENKVNITCNVYNPWTEKWKYDDPDGLCFIRVLIANLKQLGIRANTHQFWRFGRIFIGAKGP
jgi:hypothetical protein